MASLVRLHTRPPSHPQLQSKDKSKLEENVWKYTSRRIICRHHLQRALSINKTWHRHHVCIEGYLQYVACVLVDLPWWGARSIESPPAWFGLFAGGGIPPSPVSGRNLLKLNQTFTISTFLLSLATLQRPITIHNSTVDRVGIILAVVKNWAAPGRPPLSHRSLTLGLRSSGKIDESAPLLSSSTDLLCIQRVSVWGQN